MREGERWSGGREGGGEGERGREGGGGGGEGGKREREHRWGKLPHIRLQATFPKLTRRVQLIRCRKPPAHMLHVFPVSHLILQMSKEVEERSLSHLTP